MFANNRFGRVENPFQEQKQHLTPPAALVTVDYVRYGFLSSPHKKSVCMQVANSSYGNAILCKLS